MSELKGDGGELRATIHVTRKATGKVETFEITARTTPEQHEQIMGGRVHVASGNIVGPGAELNNEPKES